MARSAEAKMVEDGTVEGDDSDLPELEPIAAGRTVVVFFPGKEKPDQG